jgi:hypothetical protein
VLDVGARRARRARRRRGREEAGHRHGAQQAGRQIGDDREPHAAERGEELGLDGGSDAVDHEGEGAEDRPALPEAPFEPDGERCQAQGNGRAAREHQEHLGSRGGPRSGRGDGRQGEAGGQRNRGADDDADGMGDASHGDPPEPGIDQMESLHSDSSSK